MDDFEQAVQTIRFLSVDAVEKAVSGHPGAPMALAGIAADIFTRYLRYNPKDPAWPNRDRFVLSAGHASMLLYSVLHLAGYDVSLDDIRNFRQWDSKTPGHPEHGLTPGIETTTGPLGQGFGNAVGMALASKMLAARFNTPETKLIDYRVYVIASDGDIMEGVAEEAASLAGHLRLDNLVVIYDDNKVTIDGRTDLTFSEDVGKRFEGLGWSTERVDGHDANQLRAALDRAVARTDRPSLIIASTHIGYGSPNKQGTSATHGAALGAEEVKATKIALGWPLEPTFLVPDAAYSPFRRYTERLRPAYEEWKRRESSLDGKRAEEWRQFTQKAVPDNLFSELLAATKPSAAATRQLAGAAEQRAAALVPNLVGGSADLAGSATTTIKNADDIGAAKFSGRNIHYGVREHAMGAISNGLALSGFIPFASTFLIFSDYMRPSIRLSALMEQQVVYVFSHDSVLLGEDGPTHQPIEHLWSLRLIPNLHVFRPADALEAAAAWTYALERRHGPTVIAVSRQKVPMLTRPDAFDPEQVMKGAYVLSDATDPTLTLVATGSEVHVAVEAKREIESRGQRVRVVSMPCVEAFERLAPSEREEILGRNVRCASVEAGRAFPWRSIVGRDGITVGIERFGASAPYETLAEKLGLTARHVAAQILEQL